MITSDNSRLTGCARPVPRNWTLNLGFWQFSAFLCIDKYIRLDGVLTLRLVTEIAGDMAAARILLSMWKQYLTSWNLRCSSSMKSPRGSGNGSTNIELNLNHIRGGSKPFGASSIYDQSPKTSSGAHAALLMNTDQITGYPQK